ncbi:hypothetical protein ACOSQ2_016680 [Xanthoceras sorbifolium]
MNSNTQNKFVYNYTQKVFSNSLVEPILTCILIKYENEGYAKIGIMPRYGDADSIKWFDVEPNCTFHILNCFEDGDKVTCTNIYLNFFAWTDKRNEFLSDAHFCKH